MAHTEGLPPPEGDSVLSPLQCNTELKILYIALPKSDDMGPFHIRRDVRHILIDVSNEISRCRRSDYNLRLMGNLTKLLRQSPSTSVFRAYVSTVFWHVITETVLGRDIYSEAHDNPVTPLLDLDRPESAGIFDSDRVKEIEREVYREHLENDLERIRKGTVEAVRHSYGAKYHISDEHSMRLSVWGQQFLDLYGEEP